jgi:DNA-binding MarR family transcriptional regulator
MAMSDDPSVVTDELIWLIAEAYASTRQMIEQVVRRHGVTATQVGALNQLADQPSQSGANLARRLFISPQSAHLALTTLQTKGLIQRVSDAGTGRRVRSTLTSEGERVLAECLADIRTVGLKLSSELDSAQYQTLIELLQLYVRH